MLKETFEEYLDTSSTSLQATQELVFQGSRHVWAGSFARRGKTIPIVDGIPRFGQSINTEFYDGLWSNQYRRQVSGETRYGVDRREKLLRLLGQLSINFLEDKTFLDCCSGLGRFSHAALELGARYCLMLDASGVALTSARERIASALPGARLDAVQVSLDEPDDFPIRDSSFDIVFENQAIHHIARPMEVLDRLCQAVKHQGFLAVNPYTPQTFASRADAFVIRDIVWSHAKSSAQILNMLEKLGLEPDSNPEKVVASVPAFLDSMRKDADLKDLAEWLKEALHRELLGSDYHWMLEPSAVSKRIKQHGFKILRVNWGNIVAQKGKSGWRFFAKNA